MLVNLWATWCAPCVKELPTLDKLAAAHRVDGGSAWSRSARIRAAGSVEAFLEETQCDDLGAYQDPKMALSAALGPDTVLPTTILYDAEGKEVWRYVGDLDWTGPEAAKLLAEAGAADKRLSSRPSIAARPSAISASPAKSCGASVSPRNSAAEQDRDRRHQQGDQQGVGRARRLDQPEIEHVAEGGAEQRQRDDRAPGGERREGVGPRLVDEQRQRQHHRRAGGQLAGRDADSGDTPMRRNRRAQTAASA